MAKKTLSMKQRFVLLEDLKLQLEKTPDGKYVRYSDPKMSDAVMAIKHGCSAITVKYARSSTFGILPAQERSGGLGTVSAQIASLEAEIASGRERISRLEEVIVHLLKLEQERRLSNGKAPLPEKLKSFVDLAGKIHAHPVSR